MKKKLISAGIICVIAIASVFTMKMNQNNGVMPNMLINNIDALAQAEQPNVNECVYDPEITCIALHPTDPSKDNQREKARW